MAHLPASLASKVAESKTASGGNWLQHGKYLLMIDSYKYQIINDEVIVTNFLAIKSEKKTVFEGQKAITQEPNPVGSTCSEIANFSGAGKLSAPSNARAVVLGLFGYKEGEVSAQVVSDTLVAVTSDAQPAQGMLIGCDTFAKEIRSKPGQYITGRNWTCVAKPGTGLNTPALVQARLAALKLSTEECVKVTLEQLKSAGMMTAESAPTLPTNGHIPTVDATVPTLPVAELAPLDKAKAAGWRQHPQNPSYFYHPEKPNGENVKTQMDLEAGRF